MFGTPIEYKEIEGTYQNEPLEIDHSDIDD